MADASLGLVTCALGRLTGGPWLARGFPSFGSEHPLTEKPLTPSKPEGRPWVPDLPRSRAAGSRFPSPSRLGYRRPMAGQT